MTSSKVIDTFCLNVLDDSDNGLPGRTNLQVLVRISLDGRYVSSFRETLQLEMISGDRISKVVDSVIGEFSVRQYNQCKNSLCFVLLSTVSFLCMYTT